MSIKADVFEMEGPQVTPEMKKKIEEMISQLTPVLDQICQRAMTHFGMPDGTEVKLMLGLAVPVGDPFTAVKQENGVQASAAQPEVEVAALPGSFPVFNRHGRDS